MSRAVPSDQSVQYWLAEINATLEAMSKATHRDNRGGLAPDVDEIHYADGRIRPLSDLISGVEQTIEHRGAMVGGIFIPDRPETTD